MAGAVRGGDSWAVDRHHLGVVSPNHLRDCSDVQPRTELHQLELGIDQSGVESLAFCSHINAEPHPMIVSHHFLLCQLSPGRGRGSSTI